MARSRSACHGFFITTILGALVITGICVFDVCDPNPCLNDGSCVVQFGFLQTVCLCPFGKIGVRCEFPDPCVGSPCVNADFCLPIGTSSSNIFTARCNCNDGFFGIFCDREIPPGNPDFDPCDEIDCGENGQCVEQGSGTCECTNSFGLDCSLNEAPCSPNPCENGGECFNGGTLFGCLCAPGFIGLVCETEDSCAQNPCENGGTCELVADGDFTCDCSQGFVGDTCHFEDPCEPKPCQNGGTCDNSDPPNFTCDCAPRFTGGTCSFELDDNDGILESYTDVIATGSILGLLAFIFYF